MQSCDRKVLKMVRKLCLLFRVVLAVVVLAASFDRVGVSTVQAAQVSAEAKSALERIGARRGVTAVLGLPAGAGPGFVADIARGSELTVYFQSPQAEDVTAVRQAAEAAAGKPGVGSVALPRVDADAPSGVGGRSG